jgi:hypothetical protein
MNKEEIDPPLWLSALTRAKNKEFTKGKKGDIWVCGLDDKQPWCKETKCEDCKRKCYYMPDNVDLVKKNAKKICPICVLEKYEKEIPEEAREVLKKALKNLGI